MDYLRWILLAAGIFFILLVYLLGRKHRKQNSSEAFDSEHDVPEFSAQDWDDLDEGVGRVRIIASDTSDDEYADENALAAEDEVRAATAADDEAIQETAFAAGDRPDLEEAGQNKSGQNKSGQNKPAEDEAAHKQKPQRTNQGSSDIIVLYILAREQQMLAGDKINSAAMASHLVFGDMNIFHRLDEYEQSVYGLANMVEPGSFDPPNMHDLRTPGLTLFMQISEVADPEAAFDDMLQCAYRMAEMLDAQLCNRNRQPLTQSDAEHYRERVTGVGA